MNISNRDNFKGGFTLVEMMIVVAIIAILASVAIPQYTKYVRKSETAEAVRFLKQMVDAQSTYRASHQKFYVSPNDMNKTLQVLNVDSPGGEFEYGMKAGDTTVLVRANKIGESDYIYMFYPVTNSDKISSYNEDEWDSGVYTLDYIQ